jgi:hypothetical protein
MNQSSPTEADDVSDDMQSTEEWPLWAQALVAAFMAFCLLAWLSGGWPLLLG